MTGVALAQASSFCDPTVSGIDYVSDFQFIQSVVCTYGNVAGLLVTGMFVYGAISLSIYIRTGSVTIPTVLLLLTGGAILPFVASPGVAIAAIMLFVTGAGSFALLYYRYSR